MAVLKLDNVNVGQTAYKPCSQQAWDQRFQITLDRVGPLGLLPAPWPAHRWPRLERGASPFFGNAVTYQKIVVRMPTQRGEIKMVKNMGWGIFEVAKAKSYKKIGDKCWGTCREPCEMGTYTTNGRCGRFKF